MTRYFRIPAIATFSLLVTACSANAGNPNAGDEPTAQAQSALRRPTPANLSAECSNDSVAVFKLTPDYGANRGGTDVTISGYGFDTNGGTTFFFGNQAGSNVRCVSSSSCIVTTPDYGPSAMPGFVQVTAVVNGCASNDPNGGPEFQFAAGPSCLRSTSCNGIAYGPPALTIACQGGVAFYDSFGGFLAPGPTYSGYANDPGMAISACFEGTGSTSCSAFSGTVPSSQWCGTVPPPPPPPSCDGVTRPKSACAAGWHCCDPDGWSCGVCP